MLLISLYILTFLLVLDCLFLGLLILMQLPKKESGLGGTAFGGGAVDALIGAGSGNVLTKATRVAAIAFFVLIVSLSLLHANYAERNVTGVVKELEAQSSQPSTAPGATTPPLTSSNLLATPLSTTTPAGNTSTNPTVPATEQPPATSPQQ
ncbi:MAG TPA: preprotein translocase subunit SecG [Verrucomicrobiales bacterium]|nr:preprotein translocase subunit SecG [Verrucomicrobiales bacterium]